MPKVDGPRRSANQVVVAGSSWIIDRAPRRKLASSASLPVRPPTCPEMGNPGFLEFDQRLAGLGRANHDVILPRHRVHENPLSGLRVYHEGSGGPTFPAGD